MSVSPFNWLEAGYFYYRPSDLAWEGNSIKGHYLDKGFNIKFIYRPKDDFLPDIAIGLDDFAGTGFFTREYLVATQSYSNIKFSIGLGWGKYVGDNKIKNPLNFLNDAVEYRPTVSDNLNLGGSPSYDQWFRGDATYFGGLEYKLPKIKGLKLKIELDPFDYLNFSAQNRSDARFDIRKKDSKINFGLSYAFNENLTIDASYFKGNTFNLTFSYGITFNDGIAKKPSFNPEIISKPNPSKSHDIFYVDLLNNLNSNKLYLQTANIDSNGKLDISISTSDHRNAIRSSSYAAYIANTIANNSDLDLSLINISHINAGIELNNISYIARYFDESNQTPIEVKIRNTNLDPGRPNVINDHKFKPIIKFPVIFSSTSPTVVSHIGNPEKFYFGGINIQNVSEVQFSRNLILSSEINLRVSDSFQNTVSGPGSKMQHVRTDLVQYLKEDDIHITRMQLDYIWSPKKNMYSKISAGLFEPMFGGIGGEYLYKPFNKNFSIGAEFFYVKQRAFDQRFNFRKYNTYTGHINFGYIFTQGIEANLSFGRYLAKDDGYTLDIGRTTKFGFKSGVYFTRTDVPLELFGEGSFDKGFYFQIPLDLFSNQYKGNYSSIKVSPLTRDGGAKLIHDKDLKGLVYNSTYYNLINQWDGFLK